MERPTRRRRRTAAAATAMALVLAASSSVGARAGRTERGWECRMCADTESAAVGSTLLGPTRAAGLLRDCQAAAPLRLSTAASAREVLQVCAAPACAAWFLAVQDADLPACALVRGAVSVRVLAETFLRVCDARGANDFAQQYQSSMLASAAREGRIGAATTSRRRLLQASGADDSAGDGSASASGGSTSDSDGDSDGRGSDVSLHDLGVGSALPGFEDSSSTTQSSASELAMSYLYICLILALFNCSYLFFMRKT